MMFVRLPWPPRGMSPNSRMHWREKAPITKKYRSDCGWYGIDAGLRKIEASRLSVKVNFYPPNKRKRDLDGCISSIKAAFDGVADVIGVDDSKWDMDFKMNDVTQGGAVTLEFKVIP